jgi:DNA-binding transcriptional LysR family regulator
MHIGLSLAQIEAFYWVAQLNSFSAAASRLCTTQPGISTRIRSLEAQVNGRLFERGPRTVTLTPLGRDLLRIAERFVELSDDFARVSQSQDSLHGLVKIGAADTIALTWLPALTASLSGHFPHVEVELVVDLSVRLYDKLIDGEIDVAFIAGRLARPGYESLPVGRVANHWVASGALKLGNRQVEAAELATFPVLTYSRGSHMHESVVSWFRKQNVRVPRLHSCNSLSTIIELTAAGLGVSVLPPAMLKDAFRRRRLVQIRTKQKLAANDFYMVFPQGRSSPFMKVLAQMSTQAARADAIFSG